MFKTSLILIVFITLLVMLYFIGLDLNKMDVPESSPDFYGVYFLITVILSAAGGMVGNLLFLVAFSFHPELKLSSSIYSDISGNYFWLYNPSEFPMGVIDVTSSLVIQGQVEPPEKINFDKNIKFINYSRTNEVREFKHIKHIGPHEAIKIYVTQDLSRVIFLEFIVSYAKDFREINKSVAFEINLCQKSDSRRNFFDLKSDPYDYIPKSFWGYVKYILAATFALIFLLSSRAW